MERSSRDTVGVYLKPRTRDRLNKFIADHRLVTGQFISQSKGVDLLLDHYAKTAPQQAERALELA